MKLNFKRCISMFLCLALLFGCLPALSEEAVLPAEIIEISEADPAADIPAVAEDDSWETAVQELLIVDQLEEELLAGDAEPEAPFGEETEDTAVNIEEEPASEPEAEMELFEAESEGGVQQLTLSQVYAELTGLSEEGEPSEDAAPFAFIKESLVIGKGDSLDLRQLMNAEPETLVGCSYALGKGGYVTLAEEATIKGVKNGSTTITATSADGRTATLKVTVRTLATAKKVSISPGKLTLGANSTGKLTAKFSSGYYGLHEWSSDNPDAVTVDAEGKLTAHNPGTAKVTLKLKAKPSVYKTAVITVLEAPGLIESSRSSLMMYAGQTSTAVVGVNPDTTNTRCLFNYESSNPDVVSVDPATGKLTACAAGHSTITITTDNSDASARCEVTVIELTAAGITVGTGDLYDLRQLIVHPDGDEAGEFSYASSNKKYATVTKEGVVKGVKKGTANITIKSGDGLSVKVKVTVRSYATASRVRITPDPLVLGVDMHGKLSVKFTSGYYGLYDLSTDSEIIALGKDGSVHALEEGTALATLILKKNPAVEKTALVRVLPAPLGIQASIPELTLGVDQTSTAFYGVNPDEENSRCLFVYESDAPSVVDVNPETGEMKAVGVGSARITVRAHNNPDAAASCLVQVKPKPGDLTLLKTSLTLGKGDSFNVHDLLQITEGSAAGFTYSSSKKSVASVSAEGVIKAVKAGTANITIKTHNDLSAKLKVTVRNLATASKMSVSPSKLTLGVDMESKLNVKFSSGYYGLYQWSSGDASIAEVDANGNVLAKAPGTVTLKASLIKKPSTSKSVKLTVLPAPLQIEGSVAEIKLGVGQASEAFYGINPDTAGSRCNFVYESSSDAIASVDAASGKITANGVGTATILVYAHNNPEAYAACTVDVAPAPSEVLIDNALESMGVKEKHQLQCSLLPENARTTLSYHSSKPNVVKVSSTGQLSALKAGTSVITVSAHNEVQAQFTVRVISAPSSVKLSAARKVLGVGEFQQFTSSLSKNSASVLTYSSSDEAVLKIDAATGLAEAVGTGKATITVKTFNGKKSSITMTVMEAPQYMQLQPETAVIGVGDSLQVSASPNLNAAGAYDFTSTNSNVAAVDASAGTVAAVAVGEAKIIATAYNDASGEMMVQVIDAPDCLNIGNLEANEAGNYPLQLYRGESYQVQVNKGAYTHLTLRYYSDDEKVAAVSADGLITVKSVGDTKIYAEAYNGAKACVELSVTKWTTTYNAKSFAHAMGGIGGKTYSNSLEAFNSSYENGFRIIEADFSYSKDGEIVLWHNWKKDKINSSTKLGYVPTEDQFARMKIYDKYTSLTYRDLLSLMKRYPDFYLITDSKENESADVKKQFTKLVDIAREMGCEDVLDRFIVQIYNKNMLSVVKKVYPFKHYIFTLYNLYSKAPTTSQFKDVASFCNKNGIDMITMPKGWWSTRYVSLMRDYHVDVAVHTVNSAAEAKKLYNGGVTAIYTDFLSANGT